MDIQLLFAIVAGIVLLALIALVAIVATQPSVVEERLGYIKSQAPTSAVELEMAAPFRTRVVDPFIKAVSSMAMRPSNLHTTIALTRKLAMAGSSLTPGQFLLLQLTVLGIGGIIGAMLFFLLRNSGTLAYLVPILTVVLGYTGPRMWLSRKIRTRQRLIRMALPNAVDILSACVSAGTTLSAAFWRLSEELAQNQPLAQELHLMLAQTRLNLPQAQALQEMCDRCGVDELMRFTRAVNQAGELGTPISQILADQADDMRTRSIQRIESNAQKASLKILFPMVGCTFPAIFVVLLGPAALEVLNLLGSGH